MKNSRRLVSFFIAVLLLFFSNNVFFTEVVYAKSELIKELDFTYDRINLIEIGGKTKLNKAEVINNYKEQGVSIGRLCFEWLKSELDDNNEETLVKYGSKNFEEGKYSFYFDVYCESRKFHIDETTIIKINGKVVEQYNTNGDPKINKTSEGNTFGYFATDPIVAVRRVDKPKAITGLIYNGKEQTGVNEGVGYILSNNTGTDADLYTAIAKLTEGYIWRDGSKEDKEIHWNIARLSGDKEIGYVVPNNLEATEGQKLSDIKLTEQWSWLEPDVVLDELGEQSYEAKYSPRDSKNYQEVVTELTVRVNKKPDIQVEVPKAISGLVYNKEVQTGVNLGEGYTLSNNTATDAGDYVAKATLLAGYVWEDGSREDKEISWSIAKASGTEENAYIVPSDLKAIEGDKLENILLPQQWSWEDPTIELNKVGENIYKAKYSPIDTKNYEEVVTDLKVLVNKRPDIKIEVPKAIKGLVYNKEVQTGIDLGEGYTLLDNIATDAGNYVAKATLLDGYVWTDGSK